MHAVEMRDLVADELLDNPGRGGERREPGGSRARVCRACGDRYARYRYRGRVRADRTHTLCFECYRASLNRSRARAFGAALAWREAPAPVRARDVRDRDALMADLALRRRRAILNARRAIEGRPAPEAVSRS